MVDSEARTVGFYMRQPEVVARREAARWRVRMKLTDLGPRRRAMDRLVDIYAAMAAGRQLACLAGPLRDLAEECERAPRLPALGRQAIRGET